MDGRFGYVFPSIRGVQARREYYVSMCPLRLIPRIFFYNEDEAELPAELRAQRTLNKARVPEIARYILKNREDYAFSAITTSIDADVTFEPIGLLHIPMDARFIIDDGQHRRAAIEMALREEPDLGEESIAVVFFLDRGLARCQQRFADLNRHAIRPSRSLGVLYDHRDDLAQVVRLVVLKSDFYKGLVEMERSSLSQRSRRLFTLSALYSATSELLAGLELTDTEHASRVASDFWEEVARNMPDWQAVKRREMSAGELRTDLIHSHGVVLQAIGVVGNCLLREYPGGWKERLKPFREIEWSRSNGEMWEGRAMDGGRISRSNRHIRLTTNALKQCLGLPLTEEEQREEDTLRSDGNGER